MVTLRIEGMSCGHCAMHVQKALAGVAGVTLVKVDLPSGEALVEGSASVEALVEAVEAEGYTARPL